MKSAEQPSCPSKPLKQTSVISKHKDYLRTLNFFLVDWCKLCYRLYFSFLQALSLHTFIGKGELSNPRHQSFSLSESIKHAPLPHKRYLILFYLFRYSTTFFSTSSHSSYLENQFVIFSLSTSLRSMIPRLSCHVSNPEIRAREHLHLPFYYSS